MAVAFRAGSAVATNIPSTVSPTITAPVGLADGDLIVIGFGFNEADAIGAMSNGFTLVHHIPTDGNAGSAAALIKIASGEGASWTFTDLMPVDAIGTAVALAYTGVDTTTPLSGTATEVAPAATTTPACTAMTPADDNCMLISVFGADAGGTPTGTEGTGWTERGDAAQNNLGHIYIQELLQTTAASEAGTFTASGSSAYGCIQFALKPAGGVTDFDATGDLDAQSSVIAGSAVVGRTSTGALSAQAAAIAGAATHGRVSTGALTAQTAAVAGTAVVGRTASGALAAGSAAVAGAATVGRAATGSLQAQDATIAGDATVTTATNNASGDLQAQSASIAGTVVINRTSTGALLVQDATISGSADTSAVAQETKAGTGGRRVLRKERWSLTVDDRIHLFDNLDELIFFFNSLEKKEEKKATRKAARDARRIVSRGRASEREPVAPRVSVSSPRSEITEVIHELQSNIDKFYRKALGEALAREAEEKEDIRFIATL
jgi:hypothetical protein